MQKILIAFSLLFVILVNGQSQPNAIGDTAPADAEISNATVYLGYGAELIHQSKIKVSSNTKEVEVNLEETGDAIVNAETGVIIWKINL